MVKPHLFLKRLNHWHEALKVLAPFSSPSSLTKFRIVILHHKLVTGKPRARLAVILLTSSSCCATKSPFFCFVLMCLSFLVDAFLDLVIHFSLSFNHFLKEFHGHWCLSSYFCLSSGLIKLTFSKSQIDISFALNAGVLNTFVRPFILFRAGTRDRLCLTDMLSTSTKCSAGSNISLCCSSKRDPMSLMGISSLSFSSFKYYLEQCFSW